MKDSVAQDSTSGTGNETREEHEAAIEQLRAYDAIAFERAAVKHFGAAAGIMARQLLFWNDKGATDDFWIYKSRAEWYEDIGLKRRAQEGARKRLITAGVMLEEKRPHHGRWQLFFRLMPGKLMEIVGDDLPNAKSPAKGTRDEVTMTRDDVPRSRDEVTMTRAGTAPVITEDYSEEHSEEVSPLSPPRGASPESESKAGAGRGSGSTSSPASVPGSERKNGSEGRVNDSPRRRRSRSGGGTPEVGLDALRDYEHPRFGYNDLKGLIPIAERHDFTGDDEPHWTIMKELGNDHKLLKRVRTVVSRAVGAAEGTSRLALHLADQQTAQANVEAVEIEEF